MAPRLMFCSLCRKVFWIEKPLFQPYCPNCFEWRSHNKPANFPVADIELRPVPQEVIAW